MMATVRALPRGSLVRGSLPRGCVLCQRGAKMVLLVTGKCATGCYYCPLSDEKAGRDVTYADEMRVKRPSDILLEARLIGAEGTGLTGGDPLCAPRRTLGYIRMLKRRFGKGHHIHLYTSGNFARGFVRKLAEAGLDEIRFHPKPAIWPRFEGTDVAARLREALATGMSVGVEVPAIPGKEKELLKLSSSLDRMGVRFLNLNELEYSEPNSRRLNALGFTVRDDVSSGVLGSERTAREVLKGFKGRVSVHYCSSGFKDGVQLRRRIMRRAKNTARPFELITRDGTLLKGIIEGPSSLLRRLRRDFHVPANLAAYDRRRRRVEVAPWILERIAPALAWKAVIIEVYPTADGLEVERTSL